MEKIEVNNVIYIITEIFKENQSLIEILIEIINNFERIENNE